MEVISVLTYEIAVKNMLSSLRDFLYKGVQRTDGQLYCSENHLKLNICRTSAKPMNSVNSPPEMDVVIEAKHCKTWTQLTSPSVSESWHWIIVRKVFLQNFKVPQRCWPLTFIILSCKTSVLNPLIMSEKRFPWAHKVTFDSWTTKSDQFIVTSTGIFVPKPERFGCFSDIGCTDGFTGTEAVVLGFSVSWFYSGGSAVTWFFIITQLVGETTFLQFKTASWPPLSQSFSPSVIHVGGFLPPWLKAN